MEQIESKYRDPESKTKLKQIKNDAEKQIQRNKVILKDFINKIGLFFNTKGDKSCKHFKFVSFIFTKLTDSEDVDFINSQVSLELILIKFDVNS